MINSLAGGIVVRAAMWTMSCFEEVGRAAEFARSGINS